MIRKVGRTTRRRKSVHHRSHHRTHRRRRVSGTKNITGALVEAAELGAGAIIARELNTLLAKFSTSLASSPMLSGAIQTGVGFMLPRVIKGTPAVQNIGKGMMANGIMVMVVSTGIVSGIGTSRAAYRIPIGVSGTRYLPTVNGTYLPVVNGQHSGLPTNRTNRPESRKFRTVIR